MKKELHTPLCEGDIRELKLGEVVYLSGEIYTMRDKAHQRLLDYLRAGRRGDIPIPIPVPASEEHGAVIYHCGPLAVGREIIAAGPTTSARMDAVTPAVIEAFHIRAIIGKGGMGEATREVMRKYGCVYLAMTGGAAVLAATRIKEVISLYWADLGMAEAVWHLRVEDFGPLVVGIDARGDSLYEAGII